jgi:hypothetical protein
MNKTWKAFILVKSGEDNLTFKFRHVHELGSEHETKVWNEVHLIYLFIFIYLMLFKYVRSWKGLNPVSGR